MIEQRQRETRENLKEAEKLVKANKEKIENLKRMLEEEEFDL